MWSHKLFAERLIEYSLVLLYVYIIRFISLFLVISLDFCAGKEAPHAFKRWVCCFITWSLFAMSFSLFTHMLRTPDLLFHPFSGGSMKNVIHVPLFRKILLHSLDEDKLSLHLTSLFLSANQIGTPFFTKNTRKLEFLPKFNYQNNITYTLIFK